jgi:hypothetical protein
MLPQNTKYASYSNATLCEYKQRFTGNVKAAQAQGQYQYCLQDIVAFHVDMALHVSLILTKA